MPNASRSQCESVKPAQQSGASFAPGSLCSTQSAIACHSGVSSVERVPPDALDRLQLVVVVSEDAAQQRIDFLGRLSGQEPAVDRDLAPCRGSTFRCSEAAIIVGESVNASSGSIVSAASGSSARSRASASLGGRLLAEDRVEEAGHLGPDRRLGLVGGEPLDQRRRLDERVVGDPGHRRVPAAAAHAQPERRAHLLRARAEVDGRPADDDSLAAALVDRVVDPHRVRVLLAEPLQAEVVADLLVGGRDEDEVARAA